MRLGIFVLGILVSVPTLSLAADTKGVVEIYFQKGLQYAQTGMLDEARSAFQKVVSTDSKDLDPTYYVETYSEAYFNLGLLKAKKRNWKESVAEYKNALKISPNHKKALYYLSYSLLMNGEIEEAIKIYDQVKASGLTGDPYNPELGDFLLSDIGPYLQKREISLDYQSAFSSKQTTIKLQGNPIGDDELIYDATQALEKALKTSGRDMFTAAKIILVRIEEEGTVFIEKWVFDNDIGQSKEYWIKYDFTPPPEFPMKVLIMASEKSL